MGTATVCPETQKKKYKMENGKKKKKKKRKKEISRRKETGSLDSNFSSSSRGGKAQLVAPDVVSVVDM